jgi:uncharacterized membrane protein
MAPKRRLAAVLRVLRPLAGPLFLLAGALHFSHTRFYTRIMPPYLPAHRELVYASGVAEIAGGAALLAPSPTVRRAGMWWLLATLLAVFPANVHMALHPEDFPDVPGGRRALYARLPFQAVFAWLVVVAGRR